MDLAMPHLDGIEATRPLLQLQPEVRVIAWTSEAGGRQVGAALAAGAGSVIYKDADLESVIDDIRSAVRSSH
jgi:DNA-binding NarL/FixJ family response regulator